MDSAMLAALVDRVQAARAAGRALEIRGGGTKRFYGQAPQGDVLDVRELRGISSYEPSELVVTARCGTPLAELEQALAERNQALPFEPPRFDDERGDGRSASTVGGMVAAGLAGPARAQSGGVRDYVLGATLLNGRAEVLTFGGQVMKNVAGYDVSRVLAGSLGIFGVICEVSLKVLPVAPATLTLRFELAQAAALQSLNTWAGQPLPLNASSWHDGVLHLRLRGAVAAVDSARRLLGGSPVDADVAERHWASVRDQRHAYFTDRRIGAGDAALWRVSVPSTAPPLALSADPFIEWGGAQRWFVSAQPADEIRAAAQAARGHATRFRGGDRSAGVCTPLSPALQAVHQRLKQAFDPDRVYNPGRLYPEL